jgi:hypothetical protein
MTEKSADQKEVKPDLDQVSGKQFVMIKLGGNEYKCSPPTIQDYASFFALLREGKRPEAEMHLITLKKAGVSDEIAVAEYNRRYDQSEPTTIDIIMATNSIKGARHYFYACSNKNHPEVTKALTDELITEENYDSVMRQINELEPPKIVRDAARKNSERVKAAGKGPTQF